MPVCVTRWRGWSSINATAISSADGAKIKNNLGTLAPNYENNESERISIVISNHKNKGLHNDGNAHIIEYFYPKRALDNAEGKPLAEMIRSVSDVLAGGEFKDTTGLAECEEVNHGSVADFDA